MRGSDIEAAHCICCPNCTTKFSPQLHISCYEFTSSRRMSSNDLFSPTSTRLTSVAEWTPSPSSNLLSPGSIVPESPESSPIIPQGKTYTKNTDTKDEYNNDDKELKVIWRESVSHLSPKGLRLALEEQMEGIGERVADPCWLHVHRPAVYWNILWFSSRLRVPTGFLASPISSNPRSNAQFERGTTCGVKVGVETDNCNGNSNSNNGNGNGNNNGNGNSNSNNGNVNVNGHGNGTVGECVIPPYMWHLPTVIGWREEVVKVRVRRCLSKSKTPRNLSRSTSASNFSTERNGVEADALQLGDLFPGCDDTFQEGLLTSINENIKATLSKSSSLSSSSMSPVLNRSISSPLLMTLMRKRSSSVSSPMAPTVIIPNGQTQPQGETQERTHSQLQIRPHSQSFMLPPFTDTVSSPASSSSSINTPLSTSKSMSPLVASSVRLDRASEFLDGSLEGMRRAILEIGKYRRDLNETKNIINYIANTTISSEKEKNDSNDDELKCNENENENENDIIKNVTDNDFHGINSPRQPDNIFNNQSGIEGLQSPGVIYTKRKTENHLDPHVISRYIYIDLLTLFYMQRNKSLSDCGGNDSNIRKNDLFKVMIFKLFFIFCNLSLKLSFLIFNIDVIIIF